MNTRGAMNLTKTDLETYLKEQAERKRKQREEFERLKKRDFVQWLYIVFDKSRQILP